MKAHTSTFKRSVQLFGLILGLILVLLFVEGTIGVVQTGAAGPVPQPTPVGIPAIEGVGAPPPDTAMDSTWDWYEGTIEYSSIINCPSIIDGNPLWKLAILLC